MNSFDKSIELLRAIELKYSGIKIGKLLILRNFFLKVAVPAINMYKYLKRYFEYFFKNFLLYYVIVSLFLIIFRFVLAKYQLNTGVFLYVENGMLIILLFPFLFPVVSYYYVNEISPSEIEHAVIELQNLKIENDYELTVIKNNFDLIERSFKKTIVLKKNIITAVWAFFIFLASKYLNFSPGSQPSMQQIMYVEAIAFVIMGVYFFVLKYEDLNEKLMRIASLSCDEFKVRYLKKI